MKRIISGLIYFCLLIMFIGLSSCATTSSPKSARINNDPCDSLMKQHQIYVDQQGRLRDPNSGAVISGYDEDDYIKKIINVYEDKKKKDNELTLTVFIHGGLNSFDEANERVRRIICHSGTNNPTIKNLSLDDKKYIIFVSWNSGPFTNYGDHLFFMRRGERENILGLLSSPFVLLEDALRTLARFPAATYNTLLGKNSVIAYS